MGYIKLINDPGIPAGSSMLAFSADKAFSGDVVYAIYIHNLTNSLVYASSGVLAITITVTHLNGYCHSLLGIQRNRGDAKYRSILGMLFTNSEGRGEYHHNLPFLVSSNLVFFRSPENFRC